MKMKRKKAIYRGIWPGLGRMYNVKVKSGQATIIVQPGEDAEQLAEETQEKFARKEIAIPASARSG